MYLRVKLCQQPKLSVACTNIMLNNGDYLAHPKQQERNFPVSALKLHQPFAFLTGIHWAQGEVEFQRQAKAESGQRPIFTQLLHLARNFLLQPRKAILAPTLIIFHYDHESLTRLLITALGYEPPQLEQILRLPCIPFIQTFPNFGKFKYTTYHCAYGDAQLSQRTAAMFVQRPRGMQLKHLLRYFPLSAINKYFPFGKSFGVHFPEAEKDSDVPANTVSGSKLEGQHLLHLAKDVPVDANKEIFPSPYNRKSHRVFKPYPT